MSSSDLEEHNTDSDQTPPGLPRSDSVPNGDSGRLNPAPETQSIIPEIQETNADRTEPFNTSYEPQQGRTVPPSVQPDPLTPPDQDSLACGVQEKNWIDRSSKLHVNIPKDSPLVQRQWVADSPELAGSDPLAMLTKMGQTIAELSKDQQKLQNCLKEKLDVNEETLTSSEKELESTKEDLKLCQEEREEFRRKYDTAIETEAEMRVYYETKLERLERKLSEVTGKKEEADRQHKQGRALLTHTLEIQDKYCIELEQKLKKQSSNLKEFESEYEAKQEEVERLRATLREKEKVLEEMGKEHVKKVAEVQGLERENEALMLNQEKETTKEQLQRCQQIKELVSQLPQVATQERLEAITKQITEDIRKMKALTTRKKAASWR